MKFIGQITGVRSTGERSTGQLTGEVFTETAQRLVRWGASEPQAYTLAQVITLARTSSDGDVEAAVISALVAVKESIDGVTEVEYLGGIRRDTLRLEEGRL